VREESDSRRHGAQDEAVVETARIASVPDRADGWKNWEESLPDETASKPQPTYAAYATPIKLENPGLAKTRSWREAEDLIQRISNV
jgi:hypothetical protein